MVKQNPINNLTYLEKATLLNEYYAANIKSNKAFAVMAKQMSSLIFKANKLNAVMALDVIDEILEKRTAIRYNKAQPAPLQPQKSGPKILAFIKPQIVAFNPTQSDYEKLEILTRYINYEILKQKNNTYTFSIK